MRLSEIEFQKNFNDLRDNLGMSSGGNSLEKSYVTIRVVATQFTFFQPGFKVAIQRTHGYRYHRGRNLVCTLGCVDGAFKLLSYSCLMTLLFITWCHDYVHLHLGNFLDR